MNKYLKGCLIVLGIVIVGIAGLIIWYYRHKAATQQQARTDATKYTELCDRNPLVNEQPTVTLTGFDSTEISKLRFRLIRQGKVVQDTTVSPQPGIMYDYMSIQLPFATFMKTDTIVVQTNGKLKRFFLLADFHHYAYLQYGMMGYLGTYDCRFDDQNFSINGKTGDGRLRKQDGLVNLHSMR